MDRLDLERRLDALASLTEPVRPALYRCVAGREQDVGRDEAAATVGTSRKLAAYHLHKLAEAGLLKVRFERRSGRSGPGACRSAKIYLRSAGPLEVALPAPNYRLIAELPADAVQADPSGAARAALERGARAAGAENAVHADEDHSRPRDAAGVHAVLARHGYEPYDDEGVTRRRNCPFERLAQTHRELVSRRRPPQARPQLLGHDFHHRRTLPSSAVQLRCWSRRTTMTRPPLLTTNSASGEWPKSPEPVDAQSVMRSQEVIC